MSEEQQAQSSQAETEGQVQETTEQGAKQQQQSGDNSEAEQTRVREAQSVDELPRWAQKEIKDARDEAAKNRKARKDAEEAGQTELQSVSQERDTLREENETLRRQVRRSAFIEQIGLPNPRAAWGYVLDGTVEVEFDENNHPKNLDAIRKALREEDGSLFGNGSADGGRTGVTGNGYQGQPGLGRLQHAYENNST